MSNGIDLRPKKEEEEAAKTLQNFETTQKIVNTKASQPIVNQTINELPTTDAMKQKIKKDIQNPDQAAASIQRAQQDAAQNKTPSTKDSFIEALTFFLPSVVGGVVGSAIGGDAGAAQGAQLGLKAGTAFSQMQLEKERMAQQEQARKEQLELEEAKLEQRSAIDPIQAERLKMAKANLDARAEELKLAKRRESRIDEEQDERRFERSNDRVLKQKDIFAKREDIKKQKEVLRQIQSLEDLAEVKVLPGTIGFKIAKGIAGEVGNLTEDERQAAQISPSIYNKIKRYAAASFKGEIPESDIKLIKQVSSVLRSKTENSLREQASKFAKSRSKNLHPAHQETFQDDILLGIGISPSAPKSKEQPKFNIDQNSLNAELKRRGLL